MSDQPPADLVTTDAPEVQDETAQVEDASEALEAQEEEDTRTLEELVTAANLQYGLKSYVKAAELYSRATEVQAAENGEMALENAELLYLYGRCLFQVAVAKSDVLGGKVAGEDTSKKSKKAEPGDAAEASTEPTDSATATEAKEAIETVVDEETDKAAKEGQPFFQFVEQESDGEGDDEEEADGEEEDDFANAYEILDVARVLLEKKAEAAANGNLPTDSTNGDTSSKGKGKQTEMPAAERQIKTRLADTYDLQAEISLENERFGDAVEDQRKSLHLKTDLHPHESSLLAEAHFKLSLALEFASMDQIRAAQAEDASEELKKTAQVDAALREAAAVEMERAIDSCTSRVRREEAELNDLPADQKDEKAKSIKDVNEMIEDMKQRLTELRAPIVPDDPLAALGNTADGENPLQGLLGQLLGQTPEQQKASIEAASKGANDLSGLVRHRKKPADTADAGDKSPTKRKADELEVDAPAEAEAKRAKSENP